MTCLDEQARLAVEGVDVISEPRESYNDGGFVKGTATEWLVGESPTDYVVPRDVYERLQSRAAGVNTISNDNMRTVAPATERNDNAPFAGIRTRVVDTQSEALATLAALPGFVYLGSPYSKYALGHDVAAYVVAVSATQLMARGLRVYCPIAHGHFVSRHGKLPETWGFWKEQCQPMIEAASSLVVLMMDGWQESVGLVYEIGEFERAGKPIVYVDPSALNDRSQNMRVAA